MSVTTVDHFPHHHRIVALRDSLPLPALLTMSHHRLWNCGTVEPFQSVNAVCNACVRFAELVWSGHQSLPEQTGQPEQIHRQATHRAALELLLNCYSYAAAAAAATADSDTIVALVHIFCERLSRSTTISIIYHHFIHNFRIWAIIVLQDS